MGSQKERKKLVVSCVFYHFGFLPEKRRFYGSACFHCMCNVMRSSVQCTDREEYIFNSNYSVFVWGHKKCHLIVYFLTWPFLLENG